MFAPPSPEKVTDGVYLVGSSDLTDGRDCSVYLVDAGELVLIDSGSGANTARIARNIELLGLDPSHLSTLILTHCHIDHVGGAAYLKERFGVRIFMHTLDAAAVERGDPVRTGASWYGLRLSPLPVDVKIAQGEETLSFSDGTRLVCLHTPGIRPDLSRFSETGGRRGCFSARTYTVLSFRNSAPTYQPGGVPWKRSLPLRPTSSARAISAFTGQRRP